MSIPDKTDKVKFGEALQELESLLARIEADEVDVDDLAGELRKASRLIKLCKEKIEKAEMEVKNISEQLKAEDGEKEGGEERGR